MGLIRRVLVTGYMISPDFKYKFTWQDLDSDEKGRADVPSDLLALVLDLFHSRQPCYLRFT